MAIPYPTTPILDWLGFRLGITPVIPKFYYDAYSQEEIIKELSKELDSLAKYAQYLGTEMNIDRTTINNIAQTLNELQAGGWFEEYEDIIKAWILDVENIREIVDEQVAEATAALTQRVSAVETTVNTITTTTIPGIQHDVAELNTTVIPAIQADIEGITDTTIPALEAVDKATELSILTGASNFRPISRVLIGNDEHAALPYAGTGNVQGGCLINKAGVDYWVQLTEDKDVIVSDVATAHIQATTRMATLGHGQGLSWDGSNTLISPNDDQHILARIDITNITTPVELAPVAYPPLLAATYTPAACYVDDGSSRVAILAAASRATQILCIYADETLQDLQSTTTLTGVDFNQYEFIQGMYVDTEYIYVAYSNPEAVLIYKLDGTYIGSMDIPSHTGAESVTELEAIFRYKKNIYLVTHTRYKRSWVATAADPLRPSMQQRAATLLEWALTKSIAPIADPMLSTLNVSRSQPNYMVVEINNAQLQTDYALADNTYRSKLLGAKLDITNTNNTFYFVDDALNVMDWLGLSDGAYIRFNSDYLFQLRLNENRNIILSTSNANQANVRINSACLTGNVALLPLTAANKGIEWLATQQISGNNQTQCIYIYSGLLRMAGGNTFASDSNTDVRATSSIINCHTNLTTKVALTAYSVNIAAG